MVLESEATMKVGDLVRCTHGLESGTVGMIASLYRWGEYPMACLHTGECFNLGRLEVLSESR